MSESDPLLYRLRELPSPMLDPRSHARVLRRAERELEGQGYTAWGRIWSTWALPAVLLAGGAGYVVEVIAKVRQLFG
jgi:hypothetical protein